MKIQVNINTQLNCNADNVTSRTFEGARHIVVSGAKHMIGDTVMNSILYPSEETKALGETLETNGAYILAPAEHPMVGGEHVSVNHPLANIQHGVGAFSFNFRMEGNRLVSDIAINEDVAYMSDRGRELMSRIHDREPVDMSTGFYMNVTDESGIGADGVKYDRIASNLALDHTAILLESPGAKTSDEGVGLFANSSGNSDKVKVLTSDISGAEDANLEFSINDLNSVDIASVKSSKKSIPELLKLALNRIQGQNDSIDENISNFDGDKMKNKIIAFLNSKGVTTEGQTDEQLFEAYNAQMAKPEPVKSNDSDTVAAINKLGADIDAKLAKQKEDILLEVNKKEIAGRKTQAEELAGLDHVKALGLNAEGLLALPEDQFNTMYANSKVTDNIAGGQGSGADDGSSLKDYDGVAE